MKEPNWMVRFFSFLLRVLVVLGLMVVIATVSFEGVTYYLTGSFYDLRKVAEKKTEITNLGNKDTQEPEIDDKNMRNTLFFVEAEDSGKPYIALNMLNTKNDLLDILLIPSNAQMTVGRDVLKDIQKEMPEAKNTVTMDSLVRCFGEEKYAMITEVLENVLGISMSGYDVMTEEDFVKFLNMADHVEYALEESISYRDADGVLQTLDPDADDSEDTDDGEDDTDSDDSDSNDTDSDDTDGTEGSLTAREAMALMTYLDGTEREESARLERTSAYMQAFFTSLFKENKSSVIYKKYTNLAQFSEDRNLSDEERIIKQLDPENITIRILQGAESNGVFSIDSQKARLQVATLAKQAEEAGGSGQTKQTTTSKDSRQEDSDEENKDSAGDSKEYSIELYNAAYVAGLAGDWEEYLEEEGYTISFLDNYQDEGPLSTTRIIVSEEGMGEDLLKYFPDAIIEVDDIDTGGDIQVYIGTDSTDVGGDDTDHVSGGKSEEETTEEEDAEEEGISDGSYRFDKDSE